MVDEILPCNLLPVTSLPDFVWSAPLLPGLFDKASVKEEIHRQLIADDKPVYSPVFSLYKGQAISFYDLGADDGPFSSAVLPEQAKRAPTSAYLADPDTRRLVISLLNMHINRHCYSIGFVLRGKPFQWDRAQGPSPHLSRPDARDLISEVIKVYTRHKTAKPERVVVHKSSRFDAEELAGFKEALTEIPYWDLVAMGKRGTQFLRLGQYPPLRGTWVRFDDSNYLLYTHGYVPFLKTYPGMRVPQPQEVLEMHGTSPAETVLREILALTKLNWNSADFSCDQPITLAFSRRVGEILSELPARIAPQKDYKFYM